MPLFPHTKERRTQSVVIGIVIVVELIEVVGDHGVQSLVLHREGHGYL